MPQYFVLCRRPYAEAIYGQPDRPPVPFSADPGDGLVDQPFDTLEAAEEFAAKTAEGHDPVVVVQVVGT